MILTELINYIIDQLQVPPDRKSYEIVAQSLKTLGGALVPFHALVTHLVTPDQRRHFAQVTTGGAAGEDCSSSSGAGAGGREGAGRDQVAVVLSSFPCASACSALAPCCQRERGAASGQHTEGAATAGTLVIGQQGN